MPQEPTRTVDSRPLPSEMLIQKETKILMSLLDRLGAIAETSGTRRNRERSSGACSAEAWAHTDERRSPNVLFLDGGRGTGKTSLMLTLIRAWEEDVCGAERLPEGPADAEAWRRLPILRRLRFLPIVDYQPLPDGIPIYAWLMETFRGIQTRGRRLT